MPQLDLHLLPRYLFAPLAWAICYFVLQPTEAVVLFRDLSIQGLAAATVAGLAGYHLYRALLYPLLQRTWQLVERETGQKFIASRYVDSAGATPPFRVLNEVFLATVKDLPTSDRVSSQNAAVHGFYQSAIVVFGFAVATIGTNATYAVGYFAAAIIVMVSAYVLNGRADAEEVNLLKHHLNILDREGTICELRLRDLS